MTCIMAASGNMPWLLAMLCCAPLRTLLWVGLVLAAVAAWQGALSQIVIAAEAGSKAVTRSAPAVACNDVAVDVAGAAPEEKALICSAAQRSIEFFRQCDLHSPQRIRIEVVAGALEVCGVDVFGSYDAKDQTVRLVDLQRCATMAGEMQEYRALPPEKFYRSIVVHEVAHNIFRTVLEGRDYPHATHEYVAYAAQISSMPSEVRRTYLKAIPRPPPSDLSHFVDMVLMLAPARFSAMAYDHFAAPGNGCRILRGLVAGRIEFPTMEEFD